MSTLVIYGQVVDGKPFLPGGVTIDAITINRVRCVARTSEAKSGKVAPGYLAAPDFALARSSGLRLPKHEALLIDALSS
jgi:hypothetical protein